MCGDSSLSRYVFAGIVAALSVSIGSGPTYGQTPPDRRLMEDHVRPEQLPGTIRRAVATLKPSASIEAEVNRLVGEAESFYSAGKMGETQRLLFRALALALGREWTERDEYWRSLVLRSDMAVLDPARPLVVRLEQIYPADYAVQNLFSLHVAVSSSPEADAAVNLEEGLVFEGVGPNFTDGPFSFSIPVATIEAGNHVVVAELHDGTELIRRLTLPICLVPGYDTIWSRVKERIPGIDGHESAKASVRFPFDAASRINLGRAQVRDIDVIQEIQKAQSLLDQLESGTDPIYQATGNQKRHYWFEEAGEIMPYRLNVPSEYNGTDFYPLIVILHGNGGTDDTMMDVMNGLFVKETEKHGYIAVSPMGFRRSGGYGRERIRDLELSPERRHITRLSAVDVMNVVQMVRSEYRVDEGRIYLTGVSMGGGGTWTLGAKYSDIWAAIAPISAGVIPSELDWTAIDHLPVIVSHGTADETVPVEYSRQMVAHMEELGMTYEHLEIEGAGHRIFPRPLAAALDFFDRYERKGD